VVGPSPLPYAEGKPIPVELSPDDIRDLVAKWTGAARRAVEAGFEVIEIHAAHGYLLNQFLSPISNHRGDCHGGDRQGRMRFALEVIEAVRTAMPQGMPLFVRVSAIDGVEGGWTLDDSVAFARELKARGVDVIDCSSGGLGGPVASTRMPRGPGFQVPFAERIRHDADIATMAVGLITAPAQAAEIVDKGRADLVAIGRQALVDPNWPNAAHTLLKPEHDYAHWPQECGWWLDRRDPSMITK
jgi:2,4-dienoyl-CoA reductase-like NADH-dependent reductase (Old Yellow Enzyme family)